MKETIINRVYNFRSKANIRQEDLAAAIGVTRQTIIAIEHGNYSPSLILAIKIARYFKTNVEKIFNLTYDKKNS